MVTQVRLLEGARAAARLCGVTRLADITGLDRIGLPVWQAVRPAGRALSVHQGKGASHEAAQIGALCEAIESHCAEHALVDGPLCPPEALARGARSPDMTDYARLRERPPQAGPVQWCEAVDALTGKPLFLPHLIVSLDFTRGLPNAFERISAGLGAGPDQDRAVETALLELIERDAVGAWKRSSPAERMDSAIIPGTIRIEWFAAWRDRLRTLGIVLEAYRIPSFTGVPVVRCVVGGEQAFVGGWRRFGGDAAHPDPERALFKAFAEAVQSRLTFIAGVRDDIRPSDYRVRHPPGPQPLPPMRDWRELRRVAAGWREIADCLVRNGYGQIAVKRLDRGLEGVAVAKTFVPGLGSLTRTRRAPL